MAEAATKKASKKQVFDSEVQYSDLNKFDLAAKREPGSGYARTTYCWLM